jgi:hypothetical protein
MCRKDALRKLVYCFGLALLIGVVFNIQPVQAQLSGLNPLYNPMSQFKIYLTSDVYFPALTGQYRVGRTTYHVVDPTRQDIYLPDGVTGPREFTIWIHYPAAVAPGTPRAPYVEEPLRTPMAEALIYGGTANAAMLDRVHSHAYTNVQVANHRTTYPVVIFSHGKNTHPLIYTAMVEELTSHGFIVVSILHPHDAPVSVFPDGRIITPPTGNENALVQAAAAGNEEAINTLIQYECMSRPGDVIATLTYLNVLNQADPLLAGVFDFDHLGVFGHSFGSATAAWASQLTNQFKATLIMDSVEIPLAILQGTPPLSQAAMIMLGSGADCVSPLFPAEYCESLQQANCLNVEYLMQSTPFYFFRLDTSTHVTYISDLVLAAPFIPNFDPYQGVPIVGINNVRAVQIINRYIVAFFSKQLKGQAEPLLDGPALDYPKVQFINQPVLNPACQPIMPQTPTPDVPPSAIPEPTTILLVGLGLVGILTLMRKTRKQ